jgi:hypothetical protein
VRDNVLYSAVVVEAPFDISYLIAVERTDAPVIPWRAVPVESKIIPSQDGSKMTAISLASYSMTTYIQLDHSSSSLMEWVSSPSTSVESAVSRFLEYDIPS